jgi:apolipoprotein N-acyltransferase
MAAIIGYIGFSTVPRMATLVLAVPVLWTLTNSRLTAFTVVLAYKLAASRGLLPGAAVFLSESHTPIQAAALYCLMSFGASLPFWVFWSEEKRRKSLCLILTFATAYVLPPLSLIGIINPLIASGTIFRGWGFAGMIAVLGIYSFCALSRKTALVFLCVVALFAILPPDHWYEVSVPEGIVGVDTSFGKLGSGSFSFDQDYERAGMVFNTLRQKNIGKFDAQIIVLPETIAGRLNNTGIELWRKKIQKLLPDKTVIFGAELPTGDGKKYDNAVLMLHDGETTVSHQRIPVPYSMYRGPFAETGANLHLWDSGIHPLPDERKAAVIICYEAFLTWPYLVSMLQKPDVIISTANLWWCRDTSLPHTQRMVVSLWALTFGVPVVFVRNI